MQKYVQSSGFVSQLDTSTVIIHQFKRKFTEFYRSFYKERNQSLFIISDNHITEARVSVLDKVGLMSFRVPP